MRTGIFLLLIFSLACFSFTYSSGGAVDEDELYLFQKGTIFEYDVTYKYAADSIVTFKRYYKVNDVEETEDAAWRAKISYYRLTPEEKEQVFCNFEIDRKNIKTTIDALHLACVYRNDTVTFGKETIPLVYGDTMAPGKKFSDMSRSTNREYFSLNTSVHSSQEKPAEVKKKKSSSPEARTSMLTAVTNRTCKGQQEVMVPFDTLDAAFMYYDIERVKMTYPNVRSVPGGPEPIREILYLVHIREWYTPEYGVVKREIEDTQTNLVIRMELAEIYVLKKD